MSHTPRTTRRHLLQTAAAAAAASALGTSRLLSGAEPKTLLILGGTRFLGPEIVEAAQKSGWKITLFNRGKSNPGLFPDLEHLQGDRNGDLKSLEGRAWDAVVDTSGYFPKQVTASATVLLSKSKQYVFISSISVFSDMSEAGRRRVVARRRRSRTRTPDKITEGNYGAPEGRVRAAAEAAMPGRVTNVRPGLIVGPERRQRPLHVLARARREGRRGARAERAGGPRPVHRRARPRDLDREVPRHEDRSASSTRREIPSRSGRSSTPARPRAAATRSSPGWTRRSSRRRRSPRGATSRAGSRRPARTRTGTRSRNAKAVGKGLTFRPLKDTCKDTLAWWKTHPAERQAKLKAGLSAEREAAVLAAWHEAQAKKAPKAG